MPSDSILRDAFLDVLETSIRNVIAEAASSTSTEVIVNFPINLRRREQQDDGNESAFLTIEVEVNHECHHEEECNEILADAVSTNDDISVTATLTKKINQVAEESDVAVLSTASVLAYELLDHTILIREGATSLASSHAIISSAITITALLVSLVMIMI